MDYYEKSLELHKKLNGKIEVAPKVHVKNKDDLSVVYSPGVAEPCVKIKDGADAKEFTAMKNAVAIVSDGSAVLGLGNIGPEAAIPVMEGKALLFKEFAGIDAIPIVLNTQDTKGIIETVKNISPTFGGINLEDISAPRCFEIEERLSQELDIPVFHDDQHGTAIATLAGVINAFEKADKGLDAKIIVNGAGAAGIAITKLLYAYGFKNIYLIDSKGLISKCRDDLNVAQEKVLQCCVIANICGELKDVITGADLFIGVSVPNVLSKEMLRSMNEKPIIFALANPEPEIKPEDAYDTGAFIVATGRSDYPNQINNALVFPGLFKGLLKYGIKNVNDKIKISVAKTLAKLAKEKGVIVPDIFDKGLHSAVAEAVKL